MTRLICGIQRRDGETAKRGMVEAMLAAMNPGGKPQASDIVIDGPVGLGVLELSSGPAALPAQPRIVRTEAGWLAADARIYDRTALAGLVAGDADDATLLGAALDAWGPEAPRRLHGDFAYAHWDRERDVIELVRDHFGVRPVQYTHRPGAYLAFASLPQALLRTGLARRALDPVSISYMHCASFPPAEHTIYRDVKPVRGAHVVRFEAGMQGQSRRYWRLRIPRQLPFDSDPLEIASEVRRLLDQAVLRRLPATGPGAAEMSGGLDSTPIAVLASRALRGQGRTLFGYSRQHRRDEFGVPFIDEAADVAESAAGEPNIRVVPVPTRSMYEYAADGVDIDTVLPVSNDAPANFLLAHAAAQGACAIFSGWGGDEIVTHRGRGAYAELFWTGRWRMLHRELKARAARGDGTMAGHLRWAVFLQSLPYGLRRRLLLLFGIDVTRHISRPDAFLFLPPHRSRRVPREPYIDGPDSRINKRAYAESWWMEKRLEIEAQKSAEHGMHYVYPMLDLDLIDYAMKIPGTFFCRHLGDRSVIREATLGILPESVRLRAAKLMPYPLYTLQEAEERQAAIDWVRRSESSALVREFVATEELVQRLSSLPRSDEARLIAVKAAWEGLQPRIDHGQVGAAFTLISFLMKHEASLSTGDTG